MRGDRGVVRILPYEQLNVSRDSETSKKKQQRNKRQKESDVLELPDSKLKY